MTCALPASGLARAEYDSESNAHYTASRSQSQAHILRKPCAILGCGCVGRPVRVFAGGMILIALGGNLDSLAGPPPATFAAALAMLERNGIRVLKRSSVYISPAWPNGSGPDFYNQVVSVETEIPPGAMLQALLKAETAYGRTRREPWGPRTLDLDIIDYRGFVTDAEHLALPHPWVEERAFVLKPVAEIAPDWRHPLSGSRAAEALSALDPVESEACRVFVRA